MTDDNPDAPPPREELFDRELNEEQDQVPHGYYYAPLHEGGPWMKWLGQAGTTIGGSVGGEIGATAGIAVGEWLFPPGGGVWGGRVGAAVGSYVGGRVGSEFGQTVGKYFDNAHEIMQNAETFFRQMNDYRTWANPETLSDNSVIIFQP